MGFERVNLKLRRRQFVVRLREYDEPTVGLVRMVPAVADIVTDVPGLYARPILTTEVAWW